MTIRLITTIFIGALSAPLLPAGSVTISRWALPATSPDTPTAKASSENLAAVFGSDAGACPFSFTYNGKSSRELLPSWQFHAEAVITAPQSFQQTLRWTDPATALQISAEVTSYRDFPAVVWVLHFENTGTRDTPILEDVQALDFSLATTPEGEPLELHQINGSTVSINDFVPTEKVLHSGTTERFSPRYGHSSYGAFPFFTLRFGQCNLIAAIGWTGQWAVAIDRAQAGSTRVRAGMERTHLKLLPGESIRTPRILLLSHQGERIDAQNVFRRLVLAHYAPRIDGELPRAAIGAQSFNHVYFHQIPGRWATEAGQLEAAAINQRIGGDTLWMDAGWFPGFLEHGVGNWTPRPNDFPRGLTPVGEACHRLGLRFLLWYEPERAEAGTTTAKEHPEWLSATGIFNLGDPQARRWMTDLIDRQITEFGLDCYRQDFNADPQPAWRSADAADRQGIAEIRHIEGIYKMWDELRAKHPRMYIDNCAGGGTRIDLETIKRAIVQTRSDSEAAPGRADWEQSQVWGLNLYYPLSATFTWDSTTYDFRSYAGYGFVGEWDLLSKDFPAEKVRIAFAEAHENQPYFIGDYYPLTPWTIAPDRWMAYQFHRPDRAAGIALAFRHAESAEPTLLLKLRGLEARGSYRVTLIGDDYASDTKIMTGEALAALEIRLDKPRSSMLVRYQLLHTSP